MCAGRDYQLEGDIDVDRYGSDGGTQEDKL